MLRRMGRVLARAHGQALARRIDRCCIALHEAYENRNYDFHANGERRVLETLARSAEVRTVFDVGANVGDWALLAADAFPQAMVHAFEVVPQTFAQLAARTAARPAIRASDFGLSDAEGEVDVQYLPAGSGLATCVDGFAREFHGVQTQTVRGRVTTGDRYCAEHGIATIDFLKIDVEGYESRVLAGFAGMLAAYKVRALQFEYGYVNIAARFLLRDFYELLSRHGMVIGKVYPEYVEFREYRYQHEDFIGPNFVAVRADEQALIRALGTGGA